MATNSRIPYTQQFSPKVTPLRRLLPIVRQNAKRPTAMRSAIAAAFFKGSKSATELAANTVISLKCHGILDDAGTATPFGVRLLAAKDDEEAVGLLAKNILLDLDGMMLVETLREMRRSGTPIALPSITVELRARGCAASDNSSDLSGVLGWLREARVLLDKYTVNSQRYAELTGAAAGTIDALKGLDRGQVLFLRAMVALGVSDYTPHNAVVRHVQTVYAGEVTYNWKDLDRTVLQPLAKSGFLDIRKAQKTSADARGGRPAEVKPTDLFNREVAEPILAPLYRAAGFKDVRAIRGVSLAQLVADVRQKTDDNLRGVALEMLAIRFCQMLDLTFMGWRETDEKLVAGGEVDGFMETARLVYSRWQIQCKASDKISFETLAKEVGVAKAESSQVVLIVGIGSITPMAAAYQRDAMARSNLRIIVIDADSINAIVREPLAVVRLIAKQDRQVLMRRAG